VPADVFSDDDEANPRLGAKLRDRVEHRVEALHQTKTAGTHRYEAAGDHSVPDGWC
jgi:hypothetical protein